MRKLFVLSLLLFLLYLRHFVCGLPQKTADIDDSSITAKEKIALGLDSFGDLLDDPKALQNALRELEDPEVLAEVKKLMSDPSFNKEMENVMKNPMVQKAAKSAETLLKSPKAVDKLTHEMQDIAKDLVEPQLSAAELGMSELMKTAKDPSLLAEAMEMLKDPEIKAEVEALMADPSFQAEMKKYTESPLFQNILGHAKEEAAEIAKDPVKLKQFQQKLNQNAKSR